MPRYVNGRADARRDHHKAIIFLRAERRAVIAQFPFVKLPRAHRCRGQGQHDLHVGFAVGARPLQRRDQTAILRDVVRGDANRVVKLIDQGGVGPLDPYPEAGRPGIAAGAAIVITPWVVRNAIVMDEAIAGTTGSGRVAYQGHNPDSDGGPSLIAVGQLEAPFAGLPRDEIERRTNDEGSRLAREWALDHPWEEVQLAGKRMWKLFRTDEAGVTWLQSNKPWFSAENADRLINLSTFYFYGLAALALASMPVWWRSGDLRRIVVFAVIPYYMLIFGVLFIGDPRYHYAMYVPLAVFAGAGIAALWRITAANWRETFARSDVPPAMRRATEP